MILDQYGQPIQLKTLQNVLAAPTPMGVRSIGKSISTSGLDPIRVARILRTAEEGDAREFLSLAEEMEEKYLHYGAQLATRKRAVSGLTPVINAASDDKRDTEIADFLRGLLPVIHGAVPDLMDALGKGYSVCEILWDLSGKQWFPKALVWHDPRGFQFDRVDGRTLRQRDDQITEGIPLAPGHFIAHFAAAKSGLPVRGGLARGAIWAWIFHNFGVRDWVNFIETFGKPIRLGRYGTGTEQADIDILFSAVRDLSEDVAAILPDSMSIDFPEVQSARGDNQLWRSLLEYLDRQVSKLVLGQTLTADTGESGGGSYALGSVHNDVRLDILKDDAQKLAQTLNRDLIRLLVDLNFANVTAYPEYALHIEEAEDLKIKAEIVQMAVGMGQPVPIWWMSENFGIPLPEEGEEILGTGVPRASGDRPDSAGAAEAASGADKYDAALINAYSMGVDRLARLGVEIPVSHLQKVFGLPKPKAGEALLMPPAGEAAQRLSAHRQVAAQAQQTQVQQTQTPTPPEQALSQLEAATQADIDGWIDRIEAMLNAAGSLEEFQAMLIAAFPRLPDEAFASTLAAAFTALELRGRFDVQQQQGAAK